MHALDRFVILALVEAIYGVGVVASAPLHAKGKNGFGANAEGNKSRYFEGQPGGAVPQFGRWVREKGIDSMTASYSEGYQRGFADGLASRSKTTLGRFFATAKSDISPTGSISEYNEGYDEGYRKGCQKREEDRHG